MRFSVMWWLALAGSASAHEQDAPVNSAFALSQWCQKESAASFVGQGKTPHNWVASYVDVGNTFRVDGAWRVDGVDMRVTCRIARGAEPRFATIMIKPRT